MSETDDRGNYFPGEAPGKRLPHPESYGHWDVEQISDLLYERDMYRRGAMRGGHLKLAADEIERLRAECEALRKDKERLDYLSRNPKLAEFHGNDGTVEDCVYYAVSGVPGLTLREIIDAALAQEPSRQRNADDPGR